MILDLLSTDMYVSYNVKLAHRIGLHAAIYVTELLNINRKAILKGKIDENGFFKVDRNYVEERTTLNKDDQKKLDDLLIDLNVLLKGNKDQINLNTDNLTGLLLEEDDKIVTEISKEVSKKSKTKRATKQEIIQANLKEAITVQNEELRKSYEMWIDSVLAKQGWMSKASIIEGQKLVDDYTNRDLDLALKIINIAATNGYRDMGWAINYFEKEYKAGYYKNLNTSHIDSESHLVLADEVF